MSPWVSLFIRVKLTLRLVVLQECGFLIKLTIQTPQGRSFFITVWKTTTIHFTRLIVFGEASQLSSITMSTVSPPKADVSWTKVTTFQFFPRRTTFLLFTTHLLSLAISLNMNISRTNCDVVYTNLCELDNFQRTGDGAVSFKFEGHTLLDIFSVERDWNWNQVRSVLFSKWSQFLMEVGDLWSSAKWTCIFQKKKRGTVVSLLLLVALFRVSTRSSTLQYGTNSQFNRGQMFLFGYGIPPSWPWSKKAETTWKKFIDQSQAPFKIYLSVSPSVNRTK